MADISNIITSGIGPGSTVDLFLTFGLGPAAFGSGSAATTPNQAMLMGIGSF